MKQLSKTQRNAINELIDKADAILNPNDDSAIAAKFELNSEELDVDGIKAKTIYLKAPTGSGKTFMMLNFIDQMIETFTDHKFIFIVGSISTANLPKQVYQSFRQDSNALINFNLDIDLIESPSKQKVNDEKNYEIEPVVNSVRIMGTASFKAGTIYDTQGTLERYLRAIGHEGYTLVYFRDEAHIGAENKKSNKVAASLGIFETKIQNAANFILKVTATPDVSNINALVEIKESDLRGDSDVQLLKNNMSHNEKLEPGIDYDYVGIMEQACAHFSEIKKAYHNSEREPHLRGINPAMLIQVENMPSKNSKKEADIIKRAQIQAKLDHIYKILTDHNLSYVIYFGDEKFSSIRQKENWDLYDISSDLSTVDVIIFKVGPATGWNIPRACMLVQLREVSSSALSVQTLGRIRRNPVPEIVLPANSIAQTCFVYSNRDYDKMALEKRIATLKEVYQGESFYTGQVVTKAKVALNDSFYSKYNEQALAYLNETFKAKIENDTNWSADKINAFFNTYVGEMLSEYNSKGYYIAKRVRYGNSSLITSENTIYNIIDLELYNLNQRDNYKKQLSQQISDYFNKLLEFCTVNLSLVPAWQSNGLQGSPTMSSLKQFYWFIIFNKVMPELATIFNQSKKQVDVDVEYDISQTKVLPKHINLVAEDAELCLAETNETFAYEIDYKNIKQLPLDSSPEQIFAEKLVAYLKSAKNHNVKVWVKNPVDSGVSLNYLANEFSIANSYPDFILRKGNHSIYIEVKSFKTDINAEKTNFIYESFKNYVSQAKVSQLPGEFTLVLALVDNKTIYYAGASTIDKLNAKLMPHNDIKASKHLHERIKSNQLISFADLLV